MTLRLFRMLPFFEVDTTQVLFFFSLSLTRAKEAIIGSIQIARQATCTEFHPIPARPVFPGTMVANIIRSGPDVEIQYGQRAPPANKPLGSLLPASAPHSSEDDSSDDDSSEPSEPSSSSDDEVELPERP